jgi:hypothetical protein
MIGRYALIKSGLGPSLLQRIHGFSAIEPIDFFTLVPFQSGGILRLCAKSDAAVGERFDLKRVAHQIDGSRLSPL